MEGTAQVQVEMLLVQRPRSGRMKASKASQSCHLDCAECAPNADVLKLKVKSRTRRKVRDGFRGPDSCARHVWVASRNFPCFSRKDPC